MSYDPYASAIYEVQFLGYTVGEAKHAYIGFSLVSPIAFGDGYVFEYDIWMHGGQTHTTIDLRQSSTIYIRDTAVEDDDGFTNHPGHDIGTEGVDGWHTRRFDLSSLTPGGIDQVSLGFDSGPVTNPASPAITRFRNVRLLSPTGKPVLWPMADGAYRAFAALDVNSPISWRPISFVRNSDDFS